MVAATKSGSVVNIPLTETQPHGTPGMAVLSQSGPDVLVTIECSIVGGMTVFIDQTAVNTFS